jgi:hypothetical protein
MDCARILKDIFIKYIYLSLMETFLLLLLFTFDDDDIDGLIRLFKLGLIVELSPLSIWGLIATRSKLKSLWFEKIN